MVRSVTCSFLVASLVVLVACSDPSAEPPGGPPDGPGFPRQFGTEGFDGASGVDVDPQGNVIVGGWVSGALEREADAAGGRDGYLRSFAPDGEANWTHQFGTPDDESVAGVDVDEAGRIAMAGTTDGDVGGPNAGVGDGFVRVADADGEAVWTQQFGTSENDTGSDVAFTPDGGVVAAGRTKGELGGRNQGGYDLYVRKYGSDGQVVQWTDQFGSDENDSVGGVAVDPAGAVIVAGWALGDIAGQQGGQDGVIRKYRADGEVAWTLQFGTPEDDRLYAVATDEDGNIYAGGTTLDVANDGQSGGTDAILVKLSPEGTAQWTRQFGTEARDRITAVAAGGGEVIVAGYTAGDLQEASAGAADVFVRRYDTDGDDLGTVQFGTAGDDFAWDVARDASDAVVVAGDTEGDVDGENAGSGDAFVHRVDP